VILKFITRSVKNQTNAISMVDSWLSPAMGIGKAGSEGGVSY